VTIRPDDGPLADRYEPGRRCVALSPAVFEGRSVADLGVAAHEAGHALAQAGGSWAERLRLPIATAARLGATAAWLILLAGLVLPMTMLFLPGIALYSASAALPIAKLPVEFAASRRARKALTGLEILSDEETAALARVMEAAAWADVAATLTVLPDWFRSVARAWRSGRRSTLKGS
jgi:Zn-dependent membrane protease YugP